MDERAPEILRRQRRRHHGDDVRRVARVNDSGVVERVEERAGLVRDRHVVGKRLAAAACCTDRPPASRSSRSTTTRRPTRRAPSASAGERGRPARCAAPVGSTTRRCARRRRDACAPSRARAIPPLMLRRPTSRISMFVAVLSLMSIILSSSSETGKRLADRVVRTDRPIRSPCRRARSVTRRLRSKLPVSSCLEDLDHDGKLDRRRRRHALAGIEAGVISGVEIEHVERDRRRNVASRDSNVVTRAPQTAAEDLRATGVVHVIAAQRANAAMIAARPQHAAVRLCDASPAARGSVPHGATKPRPS